MAGIFISRGMRAVIPAGGLKLSLKDDSPIGDVQLHVHFDVSPTWLELALKHLAETKKNEMDRAEAWKDPNNEARGETLEREFESAMQCCMSCAIAFDAFYALIKETIPISDELQNTWRKKRTPRFAQVTEVLRQAFKLKPGGTAILRQNLQEVFRFRDLAVHPKGNIEQPVLHPELDVGVEWRFAFFRYRNALLVCGATFGMIRELCNSKNIANEGVASRVTPLLERANPIFEAWDAEYQTHFEQLQSSAQA